MAVRMYSTLTGREDELVPLHPDGVLRMYVCGMTPKFHPHIGHARTFVAMDVIRRYLRYRGYPLKHVQNFTDIDDKIIERAQREGRDVESTAREYMQSYLAVMDRLGVQRADEYPTVTGSMERIIEFIAGLVETGHAYAVEQGDVYFDVATFPEYGKLSKRDLNSQLVAARKDLEPGKRDPRDFALWKAAKPGEPAWASPWGDGRPGWHIECSAMVRETLGDQIDIHGGGRDLIFPHHENELAQSEAYTDVHPYVRYWAHAGLVTTGTEKMAHSLENFTTVTAVLDEYEPMAVRLRGALDGFDPAAADATPPDWAQAAQTEVEQAMDDDFNTPGALGALFDLVREINRRRGAGEASGAIAAGQQLLRSLAGVLGL